jgi:ABC-type uncharacterized transport system permease subunit
MIGAEGALVLGGFAAAAIAIPLSRLGAGLSDDAARCVAIAMAMLAAPGIAMRRLAAPLRAASTKPSPRC